MSVHHLNFFENPDHYLRLLIFPSKECLAITSRITDTMVKYDAIRQVHEELKSIPLDGELEYARVSPLLTFSSTTASMRMPRARSGPQ